MQYYAEGVLERHGSVADDDMEGLELEIQQQQESTFFLELPTLTLEHSMGAAMRLALRPTPENRNLSMTARACEGATPSALPATADLVPFAQAQLRKFPIFAWAPTITKDSLKADLLAGLTVGVMVIPQSMSYASIAGLEYVYGLYSSFIPTLMYGLTGSSGQLAVGPVAMVSLLVEVRVEADPAWSSVGRRSLRSLILVYIGR